MGRKTGVAAVVVLLAIAANKYRSTKTLSPILEISTGKLQGIETYTRGGKKIYEYKRVPFSKQPIADLRFEVTIIPNWANVTRWGGRFCTIICHCHILF